MRSLSSARAVGGRRCPWNRGEYRARCCVPLGTAPRRRARSTARWTGLLRQHRPSRQRSLPAGQGDAALPVGDGGRQKFLDRLSEKLVLVGRGPDRGAVLMSRLDCTRRGSIRSVSGIFQLPFPSGPGPLLKKWSLSGCVVSRRISASISSWCFCSPCGGAAPSTWLSFTYGWPSGARK